MAKTEQIDLLSLPHFGNLELIARQVVEGFVTGLHKSPFVFMMMQRIISAR